METTKLNAFIHRDEDFDITYVVHTSSENEAARKLIPELNIDTKLEHLYVVDNTSNLYVCQICDTMIQDKHREKHLETHNEEQIIEKLLEYDWFSTSEIRTIY